MKVQCRGIPFDGRIKGKDYLLDVPSPESFQEFSYGKLVGANSFEGSNKTAEHMVVPPEFPALFDDPYILRFLYHTKEGRIPPRVLADRAGVFFGVIATPRATPNPAVKVGKLFRKLPGIGRRAIQNMVGQPGSRFFPNPREFCQELYQVV
jgi:hypothetical protein